jgi:HD-like signal output (HDOD) protein
MEPRRSNPAAKVRGWFVKCMDGGFGFPISGMLHPHSSSPPFARSPVPVLITDQELAASVDQLPPVFSVIRRLLAVLRDPNSDVEDVAKLVRADTALAAQVLRLANSPHYGLLERVGSIEEAIQHVGLNEITRVVSTLGSRQVFSRDLPYYRVTASLLWQHTLAVAVAGEQVAARFAIDASSLYLGGLLHTIGLVALDGIAAARQLPMRPAEKPLREWEREQFGAENPEIAGRVMRGWSFPDEISGAVSVRYELPTRANIGRAGSALFLASMIAEKIPAGLPAENGIFRMSTEQINEIGLGGHVLPDLELSSLQLLSRVRAMLNLT